MFNSIGYGAYGGLGECPAGESRRRGQDPRICANTSMSDIFKFCVSDTVPMFALFGFGTPNPNTDACNQVAQNAGLDDTPLPWANNQSGRQVLTNLCNSGNLNACRNANMQPPGQRAQDVAAIQRMGTVTELTAQQKTEMAQRRDEQATADRGLLASNLASVCASPACFQIVEAIRTGQDIHYASSLDEGVESVTNDCKQRVREGRPPRGIRTEADCDRMGADAEQEFLRRRPATDRLLESYLPWYKRKWIWAVSGTTLLVGIAIALKG